MAKHYPLRLVQEERVPKITLVPTLASATYSRYGRLMLHPDHRAVIDATKPEPSGAHTIEGIVQRNLAVIDNLIERGPADGFDFLAPYTPVLEGPAELTAPIPRLYLVPRPDDAS